MARDNAPIKNTCPIIDDVVSYIDGFRREFSNDETEVDFKNALSVLEDVRRANSTLRDWGNEEYNRAEELEKERDELERENKTLKADVEYYEGKVKELEKELDAVTSNLTERGQF